MIRKALKQFLITIAFSTYTLLSLAQSNSEAKGKLFIIGGGKRSAALIKDLVYTAELNPRDHIVILPMASEQPDTTFKYIKEELSAACSNEIINLNFDSTTVNNSTWLYQLLTAKLIYISGGDQNRFMKVVLNTKVYDYIHKAFQNGSTISGTSAGAAVMSKYMITGKELLGDTTYKATFNKLWKNNIEFEEGLSLLDSVIIDQHFIKRSRYNRLLSALDAKPNFECIGIDEGTALMVYKNNATVFGESQVLRFSNLENEALIDHPKLIKFRDIKFSAFVAGDGFVIK